MTTVEVTEIDIPVRDAALKGILKVPADMSGMVIFAHGSGSSRLSRRNNYVADVMVEHGFAALLFDLLTEGEDEVYENRFDIPLLTERLIQVTHWLRNQPEYSNQGIVYFGASTGAAAALKAAARMAGEIDAVISRGGRPDLAGVDELAMVKAPTLLIVGGHDDVVIELNKRAYAAMVCSKKMMIVPGATHLFEEPGTLEQVAELAGQWCEQYVADNRDKTA